MSDGFWFFAMIAGIYAVGYVFFKRKADVVERALRRQVRKRGGHVRTSVLYYPRLTFEDGDVEIVVSAFHGTKGRGRSTFAEFSLPGLRRLGFWVNPRLGAAPRTEYEPTTAGDEAFDQAFAVLGTDAAFVRSVLTHPIREALLDCHRVYSRGVSVRVTDPRPERPRTDGRVWVSVPGIAETEEEYDRLIEITILLLRRVSESLRSATSAHRAGEGRPSHDGGRSGSPNG